MLFSRGGGFVAPFRLAAGRCFLIRGRGLCRPFSLGGGEMFGPLFSPFHDDERTCYSHNLSCAAGMFDVVFEGRVFAALLLGGEGMFGVPPLPFWGNGSRPCSGKGAAFS